MNLEEIEQQRRGELSFDTYLRPFDLAASLIAALGAFLASMAIVVVALAAVGLGRWVWGR